MVQTIFLHEKEFTIFDMLLYLLKNYVYMVFDLSENGDFDKFRQIGTLLIDRSI